MKPDERRSEEGSDVPAPSRPAPPRRFGSGLVAGVADDDPSAIGTYVAIGAGQGLGLLWAAVAALPIAAAAFRAATRLGLVGGAHLGALARHHLPRRLVLGCIWALALANTFTIGADLAAMAAAVRLVAPLPAGLLVVLLAAAMLVAEITIPYRRYAGVLRLLALSVLAYPVVLAMAHVDWGDVARSTLVPRLRFDGPQLGALVALCRCRPVAVRAVLGGGRGPRDSTRRRG